MAVQKSTDYSALSENKEKLLRVGPKDLEHVMKHYNISAEDVGEMVRSVREWLTKQPHLPGDKLRDRQIMGHLMFRGFSVEKMKTALDNYFYAPHRMPDIVRNRDPFEPKLAEYIKRGYWCVMPKKTPEDYRVTMFRNIPTDNVSLSSIAKVAFMYAEYRILNEVSLGDCWLFDLKGASLQETLQMTPVMISNIMFYILACFGARMKSVHIINAPPFTMTVVNIFKMLMKPKLGDRIFVTTVEDLLKTFPKECLPSDYGGEGESCQEVADEWCKTIQSDAWRQYFKELDGMISDETKRLTPSDPDDTFGANGHFRQITID